MSSADKTEAGGESLGEEKGDKQEVKGAEGGITKDEKGSEDSDKKEGKDGEMSLFDAFAISLGLKDEPKVESVLDTVDFDGIIKYIKDGKAKNIITMAGAGISTSAGIPDFRSPGTGLYDNLQKYNLPHPTAVFSIDYFKENPEPFFMLSKELWPGLFKPTLCHYFIKLLNEKGLLLRHYTQNIDTLETHAGLATDKCVEAHGHFRTGHCIDCREEYDQDWMKERILKSCIPKCESCEGLVKPDIVFFGEALPDRFRTCLAEDFKECDLLIILGTSLVVQPFASLPNKTRKEVPRLYINLENTTPGKLDPIMAVIFGSGFDFDGENNWRDVFRQGTCDDGCEAMANALGWGDELRNLVKTEHARIDAKKAKEVAKDGQGQKSKQTASSPKKTESKGQSTPDGQGQKSKLTASTPKKKEATGLSKPDSGKKSSEKSPKEQTVKKPSPKK